MIIWLNTHANDVQHSTQDLFFQSTLYQTKNTGLHGFNLLLNQTNFRNSLSLYVIKTLIKSNWSNTNNEYLAPKNKIK
jgi:hypothetical protein